MKHTIHGWSGLFLITVMILTLLGCGGAGELPRDTGEAGAQEVAQTGAVATLPAGSEAVYARARKDYLMPLEEYSRDREYAPEFVMIHFTSAVSFSKRDPYEMPFIRAIFMDYGVSVHYIIDRNGMVRCYVPEDRVAWHAGEGTWKDDPKYTDRMNDYAIGIELVGIGSQQDMAPYLPAEEYDRLDQSLIGFTAAQYASLKVLVRDICQRYDIPMDREHVIGHEEYSAQKTDPGELFDWNWLVRRP